MHMISVMTDAAPDDGRLREEMVEFQLAGRDITDPLVLDAMRAVPRHEFVGERFRDLAYADMPLPIGEGQTISQPYMVAYMTQALALKGGERVLEIGTGCGYAAAVLGAIAGEVYTVERLHGLAETARETLKRLGYDNVHVIEGDGTKGWPDAAPYDGMSVTASGPCVPAPLKRQLKVGGRLVIPVERRGGMQRLVRVTRTAEERYEEEDLFWVAFVPLVGAEGWSEDRRGPGHDPALKLMSFDEPCR